MSTRLTTFFSSKTCLVQFYRRRNRPIDILISMNIPQILKPEEIVAGIEDQPFASKHIFGWGLNDPINRSGKKVICNRVSVEDSIDLNEKINDYFFQDFVDTDHISKVLSVNDSKWLDNVKSSCEK